MSEERTGRQEPLVPPQDAKDKAERGVQPDYASLPIEAYDDYGIAAEYVIRRALHWGDGRLLRSVKTLMNAAHPTDSDLT